MERVSRAGGGGGQSRREILKRAVVSAGVVSAGVGAAVLTGAAVAAADDAPATPPGGAAEGVPWYRRTLRWGQTNITEADVARYDVAWWRQYWKRTALQGVIVNAGGIYAYYPSKYPLHHRAAGLGDRDLYGELARAAHDDGLVVLARMDSNRAHEPMYQAHPDWFAVDAAGRPYRAGEQYVSCINGPYYEQYLPDVLREVIERSRPEGITDNSWSGLGRDSVCHCANCARRFREASNGKELPRRADWDDAAYRAWVEWSYARRLEVWDMNNRVTRAAGGPACLWLGMNSGSVTGQARSFRDMRAICARSEIVMLDHQSRGDSDGFQHNAMTGRLIHGVLGWDKLIPESMPVYQMGRPTFRLSSKPEAEARMWMLAGFAGGIQPWWHQISAYHEDRRRYATAEPIFKWHRANEQYLVNRRPVATVGLVWSQRNTDYYGRDNPEELVDQPFRGWTQALVRARIPFLPVNIDDVDREAKNLAVLVLPNVGVMSDEQVATVRKFVAGGGALIASGRTSLYDRWGDAREDFALAEVLGVSGGRAYLDFDKKIRGGTRGAGRDAGAQHTYLRISPELRAGVDGPHAPDEPQPAGERHPALAGFGETDILPFGGTLERLSVATGAIAPLTFVPPFPAFPPESAWMRTPRTDIPGLVLNESGGRRVAYLPADIDRRFAIDNLPDHGDLLANLVRWAAGGNLPIEVTGRGLIDCELYEQPGRLILHVVNLTSAGTWRAPVHELIPIGPLRVKIRLPQDRRPSSAKTLVAAQPLATTTAGGWAAFELKSVLDHEVVVVEV